MICLNVSFRVLPAKCRKRHGWVVNGNGLLYLVKSSVIPNYLRDNSESQRVGGWKARKRGKRHTRSEDNHFKTSLLGRWQEGIRSVFRPFFCTECRALRMTVCALITRANWDHYIVCVFWSGTRVSEWFHRFIYSRSHGKWGERLLKDDFSRIVRFCHHREDEK